MPNKKKREKLLGEMVSQRMKKGMGIDESIEDIIFHLAHSGNLKTLNDFSNMSKNKNKKISNVEHKKK